MADPFADRSSLAGAATGEVNATFATTLVDEWVRAGVTDAVVCPGSRSTPMAVALAASGHLRVHIHHDERSGAFMALGLGRTTGRPAVVLTTSGTAAVQVHAAVVEADLDRVPLLVVTADRPPELRSVGAPQTIDQTHLFGRAPRFFADPGPPDVAASGSWRSLGARVVLETLGSPPGPVHLNLPFREPLVGEPRPAPEGRPGGAPWHIRIPARGAIDQTSCRDLAGRLRGRRGVLVAGAGIDDPSGVLELAEVLEWPVVADPRSGCRVPHPCVIAHADALVRVGGPQLAAEVLVRLGSGPASKELARWARDLDAFEVLIDTDGSWLDPDRRVAEAVAAAPGETCRQLAGELRAAADEQVGETGWLGAWRAADAAAESAIAAELAGCEGPTEPGAARAVVAAVPDGGALVVSSSMPVRDVEWFSAARSGLTVHANRGANGIDGVVSTAVGVALGGAPTALLIGDVALLHDGNGLIGLADRAVDLCVVVVDNDGGGIFSFLPQASTLGPERFEQLFGTPHGVDLPTVAHAHGLPVMEALDDEAVGAAVTAALSAGGVHLVVTRTDRAANLVLHDRLHAATAAEVGAALSRSG